MKTIVLAAALSVTACTSEPAVDSSAPSASLRSLGVERLDVRQTDSSLAIDGVDRDGNVVASLALSTGWFYMDDDDRGFVDGRQMVVNVRGSEIEHQSEGYADLLLPSPRGADLGTFLTDPAVAEMLSYWRIDIETGAHADLAEALELEEERPYDHSCENGDPVHQYKASSNCQATTYTGCALPPINGAKKFVKSGSEWGEWRCCTSTAVFAERACTTPNGSTSCGTAGPGGCAVCWQVWLGEPACSVTVQGGSTCKATYCESYGGPGY